MGCWFPLDDREPLLIHRPKVRIPLILLALNKWRFECWYLLHGAACNSLKVAIHSNGRIDNTLNLRFALCPQTHGCLPLAIKIILHLGKPFDYRFDAMAKSWARQILIDLLGLRLLPFLRYAGFQPSHQE